LPITFTRESPAGQDDGAAATSRKAPHRRVADLNSFSNAQSECRSRGPDRLVKNEIDKANDRRGYSHPLQLQPRRLSRAIAEVRRLADCEIMHGGRLKPRRELLQLREKDGEAAVERRRNTTPIIRFVDLILYQAIQDPRERHSL